MINSKNLALMDSIMDGITRVDEWEERQKGDLMIAAADDRWEAAMKQARAFLPKELYDELCELHEDKAIAVADAGILFGIHVADVIRDVVSKPADLSRYVLKRIKGKV